MTTTEDRLSLAQGARVIVAMSGGVDSSVAAKLLVDAGCEVMGLTMKLTTPSGSGDLGAADVAEAADGDFGVAKYASASTAESDNGMRVAPAAAESDNGMRVAPAAAESDNGMRVAPAAGDALGERVAFDACCTTKDQEDAQQIARMLGFPHRLLDFEADFEREVVEPFCRAYLDGKTPNPCVTCNRRLKFEAMQRCRRELGFDYVATGHYARRRWDEKRGRYLLLRGVDGTKDQSYFLYHLDQETLAHMLFPLGEYEKPHIRALALEAGLEVADKPESQDICFVPDGDYAAFIEHRAGVQLAPGPILLNGRVVGEHSGLARYTVGQRKGLGVAYGEPLYVLRKDVEGNALIVGVAAQQGVREIWADDVNLISCDDIPEYINVQVKANYRQRAVSARARVERAGADGAASGVAPAVGAATASALLADGAASGVAPEEGAAPRVASGDGDLSSGRASAVLHIVLDEPIKSCAPGQSVVVYDGDIVVGGGTIERFA